MLADLLGVDIDDLRPEASLVDDLATDSLDLLEVAIDVEKEFGISLEERQLERVRTYGDLVQLITQVIGQACAAEQPVSDPPVAVRIVSARRGRDRVLGRAWELTPYAAQVIADDIRAVAGARVELIVPADTSDSALARIERETRRRLPSRNVDVAIYRYGTM